MKRSGFTLVEAVVSILIVGLMIVAAVNTVGAARFGQWKTAGHARAAQLGFDLLEQVLDHGYQDTDPIPAVEDFERSVNVEWVQPNNPDQTSSVPTGVKRFTVTVRQHGAVMAKVRALKFVAKEGG